MSGITAGIVLCAVASMMKAPILYLCGTFLWCFGESAASAAELFFFTFFSRRTERFGLTPQRSAGTAPFLDNNTYSCRRCDTWGSQIQYLQDRKAASDQPRLLQGAAEEAPDHGRVA